MEHWIEGVRRILMRVPTGALAFSSILDLLPGEGMGPSPDPLWLLKTIEERKSLFRIIPFARGPWARLREALHPETSASPGARMEDDPWILLLLPPEAGFGSASAMTARARAGLLAWGRTVDDASPASVARWIRANLELTGALTAFLRGEDS